MKMMREGGNAGAVHLFQRAGDQFVHRQKLLAPGPRGGALFGERIHLEGPWLFVSAFREEANTGEVYVFKETEGVWSYWQNLENPFVSQGSLFGVGLDRREDILAVSAPGRLPGADPDSAGASRALTLYRLEDGIWAFMRNMTYDPVHTGYPHTWGFALAQVSESETAVSVPDYTRDGDHPLAGRVALHVWPEFIEDPFQEYLTELSLEKGTTVLAVDDSDGNGISNLAEWIMGQDPASADDSWGTFDWRGSRPFLTERDENGSARLFVPLLRRGIGYRGEVEVSVNGGPWSVRDDILWEPPERVSFPNADGSGSSLTFNVIRIPGDPSVRTLLARLRLSRR